jgi:PPIC-type PPIASE domain
VSDPLPVEDGFELVKVERIHLHGNPSPEEAKANLQLILNGTSVQDRIEEMARSAKDAFPFMVAQTNSLPSTLNPQPSTNVVLRCGQLALTKEDVRGLATQRGAPALDDQQMIEIIKQASGYQMQMGELARSMGFDKRPGVQKALRYELDKQLAAKARQALLPELAAELTFAEERIREAYDKTFATTFDPQLQYDLLVVPMGVPPNATAEARETARTNAQAKAQELIRRIQDGASFDALAGGKTGAQLLSGQSRTVREGSALAPLVASLKPGEVAAQPCEDFGDYCVVRVNKYEGRRKMPYELARNYIIEDFRTEGLGDLRKDFEPLLLNKYHFAFGPLAVPRTGDSTSAAPAKTNHKFSPLLP